MKTETVKLDIEELRDNIRSLQTVYKHYLSGNFRRFISTKGLEYSEFNFEQGTFYISENTIFVRIFSENKTREYFFFEEGGNLELKKINQNPLFSKPSRSINEKETIIFKEIAKIIAIDANLARNASRHAGAGGGGGDHYRSRPQSTFSPPPPTPTPPKKYGGTTFISTEPHASTPEMESLRRYIANGDTANTEKLLETPQSKFFLELINEIEARFPHLIYGKTLSISRATDALAVLHLIAEKSGVATKKKGEDDLDTDLNPRIIYTKSTAKYHPDKTNGETLIITTLNALNTILQGGEHVHDTDARGVTLKSRYENKFELDITRYNNRNTTPEYWMLEEALLYDRDEILDLLISKKLSWEKQDTPADTKLPIDEQIEIYYKKIISIDESIEIPQKCFSVLLKKMDEDKVKELLLREINTLLADPSTPMRRSALSFMFNNLKSGQIKILQHIYESDLTTDNTAKAELANSLLGIDREKKYKTIIGVIDKARNPDEEAWLAAALGDDQERATKYIQRKNIHAALVKISRTPESEYSTIFQNIKTREVNVAGLPDEPGLTFEIDGKIFKIYENKNIRKITIGVSSYGERMLVRETLSDEELADISTRIDRINSDIKSREGFSKLTTELQQTVISSDEVAKAHLNLTQKAIEELRLEANPYQSLEKEESPEKIAATAEFTKILDATPDAQKALIKNLLKLNRHCALLNNSIIRYEAIIKSLRPGETLEINGRKCNTASFASDLKKAQDYMINCLGVLEKYKTSIRSDQFLKIKEIADILQPRESREHDGLIHITEPTPTTLINPREIIRIDALDAKSAHYKTARGLSARMIGTDLRLKKSAATKLIEDRQVAVLNAVSRKIQTKYSLLTPETVKILIALAYEAVITAGGSHATCKKGLICLDRGGNFLGWQKEGEAPPTGSAATCANGIEYAKYIFNNKTNKKPLEDAGINADNIGRIVMNISQLCQETSAANNLRTGNIDAKQDVGLRLTYFMPDAIARFKDDYALTASAASRA